MKPENAELHEHDAELEEVAKLMSRLEPMYEGVPRYICALAATRTLAAMLGPAKPETREAFIRYLRKLLAEMDKMWQ